MIQYPEGVTYFNLDFYPGLKKQDPFGGNKPTPTPLRGGVFVNMLKNNII